MAALLIPPNCDGLGHGPLREQHVGRQFRLTQMMTDFSVTLLFITLASRKSPRGRQRAKASAAALHLPASSNAAASSRMLSDSAYSAMVSSHVEGHAGHTGFTTVQKRADTIAIQSVNQVSFSCMSAPKATQNMLTLPSNEPSSVHHCCRYALQLCSAATLTPSPPAKVRMSSPNRSFEPQGPESCCICPQVPSVPCCACGSSATLWQSVVRMMQCHDSPTLGLVLSWRRLLSFVAAAGKDLNPAVSTACLCPVNTPETTLTSAHRHVFAASDKALEDQEPRILK